jgi:hypothetical protein
VLTIVVRGPPEACPLSSATVHQRQHKGQFNGHFKNYQVWTRPLPFATSVLSNVCRNVCSEAGEDTNASAPVCLDEPLSPAPLRAPRPRYHSGARCSGSLRVGSCSASLARMSKSQRGLFEEASSLGIRCGFMIPIHDSRGPIPSMPGDSGRLLTTRPLLPATFAEERKNRVRSKGPVDRTSSLAPDLRLRHVAAGIAASSRRLRQSLPYRARVPA